MKKTYFLSKGIEKFSNLQINHLNAIKGGAEEIEVYIPTSGGGRVCPDGMIWSDKLGRCIAEEKAIKYIRR